MIVPWYVTMPTDAAFGWLAGWYAGPRFLLGLFILLFLAGVGSDRLAELYLKEKMTMRKIADAAKSVWIYAVFMPFNLGCLVALFVRGGWQAVAFFVGGQVIGYVSLGPVFLSVLNRLIHHFSPSS